jgi:hypothetical protein
MDSNGDDVGVEFSEIVGVKTGQVPSEEEESSTWSVERLGINSRQYGMIERTSERTLVMMI